MVVDMEEEAGSIVTAGAARQLSCRGCGRRWRQFFGTTRRGPWCRAARGHRDGATRRRAALVATCHGVLDKMNVIHAGHEHVVLRCQLEHWANGHRHRRS